MAKGEVKSNVEVILTLSEREAQALIAILSNVGESSRADVVDGIYEALFDCIGYNAGDFVFYTDTCRLELVDDCEDCEECDEDDDGDDE